MNIFPDTSFLCAAYRTQTNSKQADAYMDSLNTPLPISSFLALEFRQSLRLQSYLFTHDHSKGFPEEKGLQMLRDFQSDLTAGVLQIVSVDWADVHRIGEALSHKYTFAQGHRLADLLHVATALHLGAEEFLTFDARQKQLAQSEGMRVRVQV